MGLWELGGGTKLSCHTPGQQFFNPAEGVIRDAAQHFTQPAFGIGAVKPDAYDAWAAPFFETAVTATKSTTALFHFRGSVHCDAPGPL